MRTVRTSRPEWAPAPARPQLAPVFVDIWRADLAAADPRYRSLLSDDERERVKGFIRTAHREWWSTARGILRAVIGRYLDTDPRSVRFGLGEHGKPALAHPAGALRFNVSHARSAALYAIADRGEVGVDIEYIDRRVDAVRVAERIFGPEEAHRLRTLDPITRQGEFLRAWVRHEAIVKCLGTGIGAYRTHTAGSREPTVTELNLGPGALGAVAVLGSACELRCWEFPVEWPA